MLKPGLPFAYTFDDVLLVPAHSSVLPRDVDVRTRLVRQLFLETPLLSSAMDTVTEAKMAVAMARDGGLGVIHKNMSPDDQAAQVSRVKKAMTGVVSDPVTLTPSQPLTEARMLMRRYNISGLPVVDNHRIVGILTDRDLRFERNLDRKVHEVMTPESELITCAPGTTLDDAKALMQQHKIEKLLVMDAGEQLKGLITFKDIQAAVRHPRATRDAQGRLCCAAAVGVGADRQERIEKLVEVGVDVLVLDSAHGHSKNVLDAARHVRFQYPDVSVIVGNVATADGTRACIDAGADAVKVGIGPGSICTTRIVAGVGVPQLSAIAACAEVARAQGIPVVADGGIKYSGDIAKAFGAGADAVMLGSLLAGTDEAPGELILYQGRSYKSYRGMGSMEAMREGSSDRYFQDDIVESEGGPKLVPEGIVGRVPHRGPVAQTLYQLMGGLRASMGYLGCENLATMRRDAQFVQISTAGLKESHVHDVIITKESPNYRMD